MSALRLDGVAVSIGERAIVQPITTAFESARLVTLIGPNGAGKTTLLRAMAGLMPARGRITIDGAAAATLGAGQRARLMAYLPQGHQVHWPLPARDVVALGRYPHGGRDPARLSPADARIVADAMARADCTPLAQRDVRSLSGGERARVMVARALAVSAPILLADEPTAALDPRHQIAIMSALRAEAGRGALVIAVTHDIVLAARFSDRVLVMDEGRLVADGPPGEVLTGTLMRDVYRVESLPVVAEGRTLPLPWGLA